MEYPGTTECKTGNENTFNPCSDWNICIQDIMEFMAIPLLSASISSWKQGILPRATKNYLRGVRNRTGKEKAGL